MYRKHYALTRHPFDKDLAADDLFASASLAELNARLKHLVDMRASTNDTAPCACCCLARAAVHTTSRGVTRIA